MEEKNGRPSNGRAKGMNFTFRDQYFISSKEEEQGRDSRPCSSSFIFFKSIVAIETSTT